MSKTDKAGTEFDASLHEITAKGNPRTSRGLFIPLENTDEGENDVANIKTFKNISGATCYKDQYDTVRRA